MENVTKGILGGGKRELQDGRRKGQEEERKDGGGGREGREIERETHS